MAHDEDGKQVCDICGKTIGPDDGPAGNGECQSASGHEIVCDDCVEDLSTLEKNYIEGRGPKAGRWDDTVSIYTRTSQAKSIQKVEGWKYDRKKKKCVESR
jgi:hypothetical protein